MVRTLWKYQLPVRMRPVFTLDLPAGARFRHAGTQLVAGRERAALWFEVDPNQPRETRTFRLVMTGEEFDPTDLVFLWTLVFRGRHLVAHVHEVAGIGLEGE